MSFREPLTADQLVAYFQTAAKRQREWRVGIEQEKLAVRPGGAPVPYAGRTGIAALLHGLVARGYSPIEEDGSIIGVERPGEGLGGRITLEPGGQVEFSGPALGSAFASRGEFRRHLAELTACADPLDIRFVMGGFRPFGGIDDVPWLPKRRYEIMRAYFPRVGQLGHEMMKRTATVQANLDYQDEVDATDRIRTALGITSVVTALFAASPISEGRPNGHKSYRAAVWLDTDEARCGLLPFAFDSGFGFADYVDWALDVPMFFLVRGGRYHPLQNFPFRRFMSEGWNGEQPDIEDWELHLSTLFPEVRLKRYIEVRGADAGPRPMAEGLGALWRGLLDSREARTAAWKLVADVPLVERERVRREVPRAGLSTRLDGRALSEIAVELCRLARAGLAGLPEGKDDQPLLDPLTEYAAAARCPADDMLADFHRLGGDPARLVEAWRIPSDAI